LTCRSRKHVTKADLENHVAIYAFDLLYLNGESLLTKSLFERRIILKENFPAVDGKLHYAAYIDTKNDF